MPTDNSYNKFNNKLNSLQRCDIAQNYIILHEVAWLKALHPLKNYHHTKRHSVTLTGASFASSSEVRKSHHRYIENFRQRKTY
jgi:hypothetical protein